MKNIYTTEDDYLALLKQIESKINDFFGAKVDSPSLTEFALCKLLLDLFLDKYDLSKNPNVKIEIKLILSHLECIFGITPSRFVDLDTHSNSIKSSISKLENLSQCSLAQMVY